MGDVSEPVSTILCLKSPKDNLSLHTVRGEDQDWMMRNGVSSFFGLKVYGCGQVDHESTGALSRWENPYY
uniref:hypothetical protein n=1 Tax=Salmonella sp. TaxID=599 RepID=UPI001CD991D0|nr:hypothetical protein [Salmonella sp.]